MTDVIDKPTTSPISTSRHGDVLIVTSNNPPVNALGAAVRIGLVAAIEEAEADEAIKAVVIRCEGQTFFAGADITANVVRVASFQVGWRRNRARQHAVAKSRCEPFDLPLDRPDHV